MVKAGTGKRNRQPKRVAKVARPGQPEATPPAPDAAEERAIALLEYENLQTDAGRRLEHLNGAAQSVLRGLTVANGGAIVALFTFIGNARPSVDAASLKTAFAFYGGGLILTLLASFASFFTHSAFMMSDIEEMRNARDRAHGRQGDRDYMTHYARGNLCEVIGVVSAVLALAAFLIGSWFALSGVLVDK